MYYFFIVRIVLKIINENFKLKNINLNTIELANISKLKIKFIKNRLPLIHNNKYIIENNI